MNAALDQNVVSYKFEQFEWLTKGITAKSPQFGDEGYSTGEKPITYQERLGAIGKMESQLAKSVTALIIYDGKSETDYRYVQSHLALIMTTNAMLEKRKEPKKITIEEMALMIARMVIDFALNPELENNFTARGRLYYAGIRTWQMNDEDYRKTWKRYEKLMTLSLESAIDEASKVIAQYKKETYKK